MSVEDDSPTTVAIRAIQREAQVKLLDELIREFDPYNYWTEDATGAVMGIVETLKSKREELAQ
jgi:hypothetical protein